MKSKLLYFFVVVLMNLFYLVLLRNFEFVIPRRGIKFKEIVSILDCITVTHYWIWRSHLCHRWHAHMRFVFVTRRKGTSTNFQFV
jgi:hypothetical protein